MGVGVCSVSKVVPFVQARAAADVVVGTNNEDGVAQAIEQYVLEPLGALAVT